MTITPETLQQLIEKLADTQCKPCNGNGRVQMFEHCPLRCSDGKAPVMLGDVLERMDTTQITDSWNVEVDNYEVSKLMRLWKPLGFNRSLNDIFDSAEWEEVETKMQHGAFGMKPYTTKRIKDPHTRELFEYLCSLFLKTES